MTNKLPAQDGTEVNAKAPAAPVPPPRPAGVPWPRIIAEFLAIFAGVTLSLVADDWLNSREDRNQETAILTALTSDLEAEYAELENLVGRLETWDTAGARLHSRIGTAGPPPDSVDAWFRPMFFYRTYRPVSTAYLNLREGGQLALIDRDDLRSAITGYYEIEQDYMIQFYDIVMETYFMWRRVAFRHVQIIPSEPGGSFFPPQRLGYRTSWSDFQNDPDAPALLTDLSLAGGNFAARVRSAMERNAQLRLELRRALGDGV